jgi:uncharacterized protein YlaN (UPF0358 family)
MQERGDCWKCLFEISHRCRNNWNKPCPEGMCYEEYTGSKVKQCLLATVEVFQDGYMHCPVVDCYGCEYCMERLRADKSLFRYDASQNYERVPRWIRDQNKNKEDTMTTYFTKCGIEFQKSTNAETTGYHLKEDVMGFVYNPKCAKCPFVIDVKEGYPEQRHKRWECRAGSQPPKNENVYCGGYDDKQTLRVASLDHDFLESVIAFARNHPELGAQYVQDWADCRRVVSISCSSNKKGMAAKRELIEKFFPSQEVTLDLADDPDITGQIGKVTCENCANYDPTGKDVGVCELTNKPVSRVRPAQDCDDFEQDTFDDEEELSTMDLEDQLDTLLADGDAEDVNKTPEAVIETVESVSETAPDVIKPVEMEQAPGFDYDDMDESTAAGLRLLEKKLARVKMQAVYDIGQLLKIAHDDLAKAGSGSFGAWVESIGFSRQGAQNYIQAYDFICQNFDRPERAIGIQPSLLFAASKPSAPPELQQAVIDGDITKHKDYIEAMRKLKDAEKAAEDWHKAYEVQRSAKNDVVEELEESERRREASAKSYQDESKRVQELVNDQIDRNRKIFDLEQQIDQLKANSDPARIEQQDAQIYELQKKLDQARKDLTDAQDEAQELEKRLNAKPIEAAAVEVREVVPEELKQAWAKQIYDSMTFMVGLKESDFGLLAESIDFEDFGMYDGLADAVVEKMREFQGALDECWKKEEPTDEN